jgi:hypothetical protein
MMMRNRLKTTSLAAFLAMAAVVPNVQADQMGDAMFEKDRPGGLAMTADALIARPFLVGATLVGGGLYVISLPFSLAGGNTAHAWDTLVALPASHAFVRCLGCTPVQDQRNRAERRTAVLQEDEQRAREEAADQE